MKQRDTDVITEQGAGWNIWSEGNNMQTKTCKTMLHSQSAQPVEAKHHVITLLYWGHW